MARISYGDFLQHLYGAKVQKLNVNAGFTCPNRDGTLGHGGCTYCNNTSFTPSFSKSTSSVTQQLIDGKHFYENKYSSMKYLAFFQSFTGTYAPLRKLKSLYEEALSVPDVVGVVISTRPDCLSDDILAYLAEINKSRKVILELGIETSHDKTLELINRCHSWKCSTDAIVKTSEFGLTIGVHLILGLPGETIEDMLNTVNSVSQLPINIAKFHQLQVLRGTQLAKQWQNGEVKLLDWTAQEYAILCQKVINLLPERIVIERMVSTAPAELLIHPKWGLKPSQFHKIFGDFYKKINKTLHN